MITFFKSNDLGYEKWLRDNPRSYVFNDFRGMNSAFKTLHINGCKLLHSPGSALRGTVTLKVCSTELCELIDWLNENRGAEGEGHFPCEVCRPFDEEDDNAVEAWDSRVKEIIWQ
jgi:hypothetical protein